MKPEDAVKIKEDNLKPRLQRLITLIDGAIEFQFKNGSDSAAYDKLFEYTDLIPNVMQHYISLGWHVKCKHIYGENYLVFRIKKPKKKLRLWLSKWFS